MLSQRVSDRFLSIGLYGLIAIGMVYFGSRMINYALDAKFYNDYLTEWEMALLKYRHQSGRYPQFSGGNQQNYMLHLVKQMKRNMMAPPASNTDQPFQYVIDKIGYGTQKIFLLALSDRMILYNLPPGTIHLLDKMIDGHQDLTTGLLTGQKSKDAMTYIGTWKL